MVEYFVIYDFQKISYQESHDSISSNESGQFRIYIFRNLVLIISQRLWKKMLSFFKDRNHLSKMIQKNVLFD